MPDTSRLVTAEELGQCRSDDHRFELVEGRLVPMTPVGFVHGRVVMRFGSLLERHARTTHLGEVLTEVGLKLKSDPDTVRAPDIAFIRRDRIPDTAPTGFWHGAADLAVEVLSPEDSPSDVHAKVKEYLALGTPTVLVIDPRDRSVSVFRYAGDVARLSGDDVLDLDDVVPGFRCAITAIFE